MELKQIVFRCFLVGRRKAIAAPTTGALAISLKRSALCSRRAVLITGVLLFIVFQYCLILYLRYGNDPNHKINGVSSNSRPHRLQHENLKDIRQLQKEFHNFTDVTGQPSENVTSAASPVRLSIEEIRRKVAESNDKQIILNADLFGALQNDSVIIVVQVHKRISYLRLLIKSLSLAKDISSVLLVFSHDYYDTDIIELVKSIDFCKVLQIFYPHSMQMHAHEFPGEDPNDCPRNLSRDQARLKQCNNADYPDVYGHYREAKFAQIKHHWWWKASRVFDHLRATKHHTGLVLFLEEDHYLAGDFLHMLGLMQVQAANVCPICNILSLGTYLKRTKDYSIRRANEVEVAPWISSKHNMGFALNRTVWRDVAHCTRVFCTYDDYNWDWSLQYVSQQCLERKLVTLVVKGPRVFHIGECGVHQKKEECDSDAENRISQQTKSVAASLQLFPRNVTVAGVSKDKAFVLRKGNGGWGDKRDHNLCISFTTSSRNGHQISEQMP